MRILVLLMALVMSSSVQAFWSSDKPNKVTCFQKSGLTPAESLELEYVSEYFLGNNDRHIGSDWDLVQVFDIKPAHAKAERGLKRVRKNLAKSKPRPFHCFAGELKIIKEEKNELYKYERYELHATHVYTPKNFKKMKKKLKLRGFGRIDYYPAVYP